VQRVELGESNHVWFVGDMVLRMSARPGGSNLLTEVQVVGALPAGVGYPSVVDCGIEDGYEWMATKRLPGQNLGASWKRLDGAQRRVAMTDLCRRVRAIGGADLDDLPSLAPTPLYALQQSQANEDLATCADVFDAATARQLRAILDEGFDAMNLVTTGLVHSDTGPHNAVWDGRSAIPVDFEFATIGPADLDIDGLARSTIDRDGTLLYVVAECLGELLHAPGAEERIRAYAVLRDLWGLGKWIANAPERRNIATWRPTLNLQAHANRSSWVSTLSKLVH
jgi:scyllo-inosamine 4-kinase